MVSKCTRTGLDWSDWVMTSLDWCDRVMDAPKPCYGCTQSILSYVVSDYWTSKPAVTNSKPRSTPHCTCRQDYWCDHRATVHLFWECQMQLLCHNAASLHTVTYAHNWKTIVHYCHYIISSKCTQYSQLL